MPLNVSNISFGSMDNQPERKTKAAALCGSVLGLSCAVAGISKGRGNKIPVQNFKAYIKSLQNLEFDEKDVILLASSSISGGLLGGVMTDGKNAKAKVKEGVVQLVGNYIFPSLFVGGAIKLNKFLFSKYNVKNTKFLKILFGGAGLVSGVISGNKVSKIINKYLFKEKTDRPLTINDWLLQGDNVCLVASMSGSGSKIAKAASKIIPPLHIMPGYFVGIKNS